MKTKISIEIKLKDGKELKLDYEDGKQLFEELKKVYGEKVQEHYYPWIVPMEPIRPYYDSNEFTIKDNGIKITCNCKNSNIS